MAPNPVKRGLKVQIEVDTGVSLGARNRVDCYIIEPDYDRLTISFPEARSDLLPYLTEGSEIKAFVYPFSGIIVVNSVVFDAPFDGRMVIEFNEENQVIQRRKYLRMPYITDLYLQLEEGNIKVNTLDIGGGGVRFIYDKTLPDSMNLTAQLRYANYEPLIKLQGMILKKNFYKPNEYVLEFMQIKEVDRDKIIKKCIDLEREQNKKY